MRIGIIGVGFIGKRLARKFSAAGHSVSVANSRGPETIPADVLEFGARPAAAADAVKDAEVVILSIQFGRIPDLAGLVGSAVPKGAVIMDTSNYYPMRDGVIAAVENGQAESVWVAEKLGRPIVKAWNSVLWGTLESKGVPRGTPGRIALPVCADADEARHVGMKLVEETGFDAFDAGTLADSWRVQPGAPAYCTELTLAEMPKAIATVDRMSLPRRRDLEIQRLFSNGASPPTEEIVRVCRAVANAITPSSGT